MAEYLAHLVELGPKAMSAMAGGMGLRAIGAEKLWVTWVLGVCDGWKYFSLGFMESSVSFYVVCRKFLSFYCLLSAYKELSSGLKRHLSLHLLLISLFSPGPDIL